MSLAGRLSKIVRTPLMTAAPSTRALAAERFATISAQGEVASLGVVRTSAAFAQRFDAEVASSGLELDLSRGPAEARVQVCRVCGNQAGRYDTRCNNCKSDLTSDAQVSNNEQRRLQLDQREWQAQVRAGRVPEARFARVLEGQALSSRPWKLAHALSAARFEAAAAEAVAPRERSVLDRFLAAFVTSRG